MQNEYYQLAALIVAASIALYVLYIITRALLSFLSNNPALVCTVSLILALCACAGLLVPNNPLIFENITLIIISSVTCFYSAASYNHKRFGG